MQIKRKLAECFNVQFPIKQIILIGFRNISKNRQQHTKVCITLLFIVESHFAIK